MAEGRRYGGETAPARAERRRRQLLDAGLLLIGTDGFRQVTVRQVCAAARIAPRNFYAQFEGTEELLVAVYEECMDRLERAVAAEIPAAGGSPTALIDAGLAAYLREVERDRALARVVWFEVLGVSDQVEAAYLRRTETFVSLMEAMIDGLGVETSLPPAQRVIFVRALVGGVSEVTRRWVKDGFTTPIEDIARPLRELLLMGTRPASRPTGKV